MNRPILRGRCGNRAGFSLMEITMALGIFAFVIVGIFGLLPIALNSATETRHLSLATHIAQSALAELRAGPFDAARVRTSVTPETEAEVNLGGGSGALYFGCNGDGAPAGERTVAAYESGSAEDVFLTRVGWALLEDGPPRLSQIVVDVEYPAGAAVHQRRRQTFTTLIVE